MLNVPGYRVIVVPYLNKNKSIDYFNLDREKLEMKVRLAITAQAYRSISFDSGIAIIGRDIIAEFGNLPDFDFSNTYVDLSETVRFNDFGIIIHGAMIGIAVVSKPKRYQEGI